ncbi:MAG: SDR family oxidoreductase [Gemmatimonadetes bacterium]|nr:SDR family oxidoreductase [Gemmatimonadota bacterium]
MSRRTVLVTGGTGALGRAVVRQFAAAGHSVHVPWVVKAELDGFRDYLGSAVSAVQLCETDVTSEPAVASLFRAIESAGSHVEVLANVVGGFVYAALDDTDLATWDNMLRINATSAFLCSRAAARLMKANRWGRIINVSSGPALNRGAANMSAYSAAKAAVLNLSESLAKELGSWGITVNAIVPSVIDTPANRKAMPNADTLTWLEPEEIAAVIGFLAGDDAAIVTGSAINLARGGA